ncbi:hypothetical protein LTR10_018162 [Elasticomyces elasticus]|uniref:Uncharacterized protein n=1 Tax=Exophiala sideris TaxID=1016849 RepID=A0ABR0J2N0_9EURO|nr:hypothetical protein LTR10_018162 [Elasticomyces elasticus]KAK5024958.1 hypothetical protein LTS07_008336 [Exophiala sideris]KAK5031453.1 hypothetical protein LTR13_007781 [Exophiala sideris]KAK5054996.1 hypothetical protein LTR69_008564 [Exophiala sideris]KAK5179877.1 hypothetical protein LTR44_007693 [Eurotiomycetes sp. CCFEE 6388]
MAPLTNNTFSHSVVPGGKSRTHDSSHISHISAENVALPPSPPNEEEEARDIPSSPPISSFVEYESQSGPHEYFLQSHSQTRAQSPPRRMRQFSSGAVSSPPMQRAHSSPGVDSSGRYMSPYATIRRPSSPLHSGRRRSPLRSAMEESYPTGPSWSGLNIEPNIPEHAELDLSSETDLSYPSPLASFSNTFPRARRRTNIPLHQSASAPSLHVRASSPMSGRTSPSPSLAPPKYAYESYPNYSYSSASSVPSTPTSLRSRSPSISSLETIEDTPDAEEAALLEEEEAKLKGDDSDTGEPRRRSSLELRASNLRSNKERKRWSVCGAERRADFSLAPIEE